MLAEVLRAVCTARMLDIQRFHAKQLGSCLRSVASFLPHCIEA